MKIKKLIQILECIEGDYNGKLPQDMYELGSYTRESGAWIGIDDMDFVHVMRAFEKMQETLAEEVRTDTQEGKVVELEQEVSILREQKADLHKILEKRSYMEVTAPRYVFSEIPNDCDGQRFVDDARKYFNRSRYNMRVRGQHIKEEYKGTGATAHGQNIQQSTHLRVYIEEK